MKVLLLLLLLVPALAFAGTLEEPKELEDMPVAEEDPFKQPQEDHKRGWSRKMTLYQGFLYHVSALPTSWQNAQKICQKIGANLVKIVSAEENEFVLKLSNKFAKRRVLMWIGLGYWSSDKKFHWRDGSLPQYTHWAPREPNGKGSEPCSNMWTNPGETSTVRLAGTWNDLRCPANKQYLAGFICKKLK